MFDNGGSNRTVCMIRAWTSPPLSFLPFPIVERFKHDDILNPIMEKERKKERKGHEVLRVLLFSIEENCRLINAIAVLSEDRFLARSMSIIQDISPFLLVNTQKIAPNTARWKGTKYIYIYANRIWFTWNSQLAGVEHNTRIQVSDRRMIMRVSKVKLLTWSPPYGQLCEVRFLLSFSLSVSRGSLAVPTAASQQQRKEEDLQRERDENV